MNLSIPFENRRVLVLNKTWTAINIVSLIRAMSLLLSTYKNGDPKACIIDSKSNFATYTWSDWSSLRPQDDEHVIRTSTDVFKIPEVVLLTKYDKLPCHKTHFSRRTLYKRDNFTCQYCGARPGSEELTVEHIIPRAQGGKTTWENCVLACVECNSRKGNRTPEQANMILKTVPKRPERPLFRASRRTCPKSWEHFLSEVYWDTELINDN